MRVVNQGVILYCQNRPPTGRVVLMSEECGEDGKYSLPRKIPCAPFDEYIIPFINSVLTREGETIQGSSLRLFGTVTKGDDIYYVYYYSPEFCGGNWISWSVASKLTESLDKMICCLCHSECRGWNIQVDEQDPDNIRVNFDSGIVFGNIVLKNTEANPSEVLP